MNTMSWSGLMKKIAQFTAFAALAGCVVMVPTQNRAAALIASGMIAFMLIDLKALGAWLKIAKPVVINENVHAAMDDVLASLDFTRME